MKTTKIIATTATTALSFFGLTATAFAQNVNPCGPNIGQFSTLCGINQSSIPTVVSTAITIILVAAVLIALFFLIWGGIRWILSGGDKAKVESARNTIIAAIVGLVIAFLAFFILTIVLSVFNLSLANLTLPTV